MDIICYTHNSVKFLFSILELIEAVAFVHTVLIRFVVICYVVIRFVVICFITESIWRHVEIPLTPDWRGNPPIDIST
jgi:hypothetical protein